MELALEVEYLIITISRAKGQWSSWSMIDNNITVSVPGVHVLAIQGCGQIHRC